jgi:ribose 5-phosphate isomerase B
MKRVVLAADHAGFALKQAVKQFLEEKGVPVEDVGASQLIEGDDYPPYMIAAAKRVGADRAGQTCAIVFGGSGNGEAMVCNRFAGVRAAVWYGGNSEIVKLSRTHNDANVLSIGARFVEREAVLRAVALWLETPFSGAERHQRRIAAFVAVGST